MSFKHDLLQSIVDVPDFPKPGILFKDIGPLLSNPALLNRSVSALVEMATAANATHIIGIESRGFLFGVPLALAMHLPFVPARKKGKLPSELLQAHYTLEYGTDCLEIQKAALQKNARYFIVDDVIATGGTASAIGIELRKNDFNVVGYGFLLEIGFLNGRAALKEASPSATVDSCLVV